MRDAPPSRAVVVVLLTGTSHLFWVPAGRAFFFGKKFDVCGLGGARLPRVFG